MARQAIRIPRVREVRLPGLPREPRGWGRSEVTLFPRGQREVGTERFRPEEPAGDPPAWWTAMYPGGTKPEWAVYWALIRLGYRDGTDFFVHAVLPGVGRSYYSQVDFLLPDLWLGIEVQGLYWHYTLGSERQQRDVFRIAYFAQRGIDIVFIDEDDAVRDPLYYVREALQRRDHSKLNRRV